jgi:hypothetical protein
LVQYNHDAAILFSRRKRRDSGGVVQQSTWSISSKAYSLVSHYYNL